MRRVASGYQTTLHQPSQVHPTVLLGNDTVIWPFSTILEGSQLGKRCVVGTCVFIGRRCLIGDEVHFHPGAAIPNEARIGHRVYVGPNVVLANDALPYVDSALATGEHRPPIIEDDVILGANAVILPGVRVGRGAIVGAGAVVTCDVPPFTRVVGNPARPMRARVNETFDTDIFQERAPYG